MSYTTGCRALKKSGQTPGLPRIGLSGTFGSYTSQEIAASAKLGKGERVSGSLSIMS